MPRLLSFVSSARRWYLYLSRPVRVGLKASGLEREKKRKDRFMARARTERRKERPRKLEEFGNAWDSWRQKTRNDGVPHRHPSFLTTPSSVFRCLLSQLLFSSRFTRRVILARAERAARSAVEIPMQIYEHRRIPS